MSSSFFFFFKWCKGILGYVQNLTTNYRKEEITGKLSQKRVSGPSTPVLPKLFLKIQILGFYSLITESESGGWVFPGIFILKKYLDRPEEKWWNIKNDYLSLVSLREFRCHYKEQSQLLDGLRKHLSYKRYLHAEYVNFLISQSPTCCDSTFLPGCNYSMKLLLVIHGRA